MFHHGGTENTEKINIYWLGGSPCSGKTSIAAAIAARYGFSLFRCDDRLFEHMAAADPVRQPAMAKVARLFSLGGDAMWMRSAEELVDDVLAVYWEEFPLLLEVFASYPQDRPILAEGNAWLPELLQEQGVPPARAAYLVPTREFQREHYSRREFIRGILAQCSDPQTAFDHWMERDARFGEIIRSQATAWGASLLRVDGSLSLEETQRWVEQVWGLNA